MLALVYSTLYKPCPLDLAKPLVNRLGSGLIGWDQRIHIPANQVGCQEAQDTGGRKDWPSLDSYVHHSHAFPQILPVLCTSGTT